MGNACNCQKMIDPDSDFEDEYAGRQREGKSSKFRRLLSPSFSFPFSSRRNKEIITEDLSFKAANGVVVPAKNASFDTAMKDMQDKKMQALKKLDSSPRLSPLRLNGIPKEELNKEADDFIKKMRTQMKIERKESEIEFLQRLERGT